MYVSSVRGMPSRILRPWADERGDDHWGSIWDIAIGSLNVIRPSRRKRRQALVRRWRRT